MEERIIQAGWHRDYKSSRHCRQTNFQRQVGNPESRHLPSFGVIRADVTNINGDAIQKAVKDAEKQSGTYLSTDVYVGIAGSHVNSLQPRAILMRPNYDDVISQRYRQAKGRYIKTSFYLGDMIIGLPWDHKVDPIISTFRVR